MVDVIIRVSSGDMGGRDRLPSLPTSHPTTPPVCRGVSYLRILVVTLASYVMANGGAERREVVVTISGESVLHTSKTLVPKAFSVRHCSPPDTCRAIITRNGTCSS